MAKYSDINTEFLESNLELSPITIDRAAIIKGILRFLQTPKGSDPFNRAFGCTLYTLLFENNLETTDAVMFLYMDLTEFEPRINILPSDISITKVDNATYKLTCAFSIPALNNETISLTTNITEE